VIVDEAYLEYTDDFETRSAVSLVREGANVLVFRTFDKIHGLAESLGRLNIAAASAALADTAHVGQVRTSIAAERAKWVAILDELQLPHTHSLASFIFFNAGRPQAELAASLRARGVDIGRTFPPYTNWARITIGRPEENRIAQQNLREILQDRSR
jgi:histidinol-phosphate aminotransferase